MFFHLDSRLRLSQYGRYHTVNVETALQAAQTLNLSKNVSKFYTGQDVSLMNEQQIQNLLLKVDPWLSTIRHNKVIAQSGELETSAQLRVFFFSTTYMYSFVL